MKENWKDLGFKEKTQYVSAIALIASGVILAFLCAIFNFWDITTGVLLYVAQAFVAAGSIYGVSMYFKNSLGEFESKVENDLERRLKRYEERKLINETDIRKELE